MRKSSLILALVIAILVLPGLGYSYVQAGDGNCTYSLPTNFAAAGPAAPAIAGEINQVFSTWRATAAAASGTRVLAPATFDVTDQKCVNGFSWLQITYTSGTTAGGAAASSLGTGWALESQLYFDGTYGPGTWLVPAGTVVADTCDYSYATQFAGASDAAPIPGEINEVFSTLRTAPGAFGGTRVLAPATFDVREQRCVNGFSWVRIQYTSGTTSGGGSAANLGEGWALESQIYFDGTYGPGTWLVPTAVAAS
jgi:hypothetical protein